MLEASVIIPTYNRINSLKACLAALANQTLSEDKFEVIVVDDGSLDGTLEFMRILEKRSKIKIRCYHQANLGPATARNLGLKKAGGQYTAFTDDDCMPEADWLEKLLDEIPDDPQCAGIGGKIIRKNNSLISRYIDHCGAMQHGVANDSIQYLVTANALYRTACILEVEGFDERICWPGGEDPDLSFRIKDLGYYFTTTHTAVIRHDHRDSLVGIFRMFWNHGRGRCALAKLGRIKKMNMGRFLVNQYINSPIKYLKSHDLKVHERIIFCILRWVQYTGIYFGYLQCRDIY